MRGATALCRPLRPHPPLPLLACPRPQYATHPEPIVADSCIVALDMLDFEQSGSFQYADTGTSAGTAAPEQPQPVAAS